MQLVVRFAVPSGSFPALEPKGQDFVGLPLERARHDRDVYRPEPHGAGSSVRYGPGGQDLGAWPIYGLFADHNRRGAKIHDRVSEVPERVPTTEE
jgi:hypothetical protein